jgi:hypothetical protein
MNASDAAQPFFLRMGGKAAETTSPAHSIMTLVISSGKGKAVAAAQERGLPTDRI